MIQNALKMEKPYEGKTGKMERVMVDSLTGDQEKESETSFGTTPLQLSIFARFTFKPNWVRVVFTV